MARGKAAPAPAPALAPDLVLLRELVHEQLANIRAQAAKDPTKATVSWMAKGDHLVLLVVERGKARLFSCDITGLEELP